MAKIRRTPLQTKENVARRPGGMKQTALYKKSVKMDLYGNNPAELQQVAAHIRSQASDHELVVGGKNKRKVSVAHGASDTPKKVFDGIVG